MTVEYWNTPRCCYCGNPMYWNPYVGQWQCISIYCMGGYPHYPIIYPV